MAAKVSDNALTIWGKRYYDQGEKSPADVFDRISGGNKEYREMLGELLFLPNSPTIFNLGVKNQSRGTLSACFVFNVDDSLLDGPNSIMATEYKAAAVAKAGGGVGYYFGNLRPKNAAVNSTHRKACGPVAVLRRYNTLRALITQGGKRDLAQMGVLDADHPDFREFIHCKDDDPQGLGSFNISGAWKNKHLEHAFRAWDKPESDWDSGESSYWFKLFREQCESAWKTGDPGMLFWDAINRANATPHLGDINATNPCLTAETKVYVADGRGGVPIGQLAEEGKDVPVYCPDDDGGVTIRMMRRPRLTGSKVPVVKVTLDSGATVRCTRNHKFLLRSGRYVEAASLKAGDSLSVLTTHTPEVCDPNSQSRNDRYVSGYYKSVSFYEHELACEFQTGRTGDGDHAHHKDGNRLNNAPENMEWKPPAEHLSSHSAGAANPNHSGATNGQLLRAGTALCKSLGRRFSAGEWREFALAAGLPAGFGKYREKTLGTREAFAKRCAELAGVADHAGKNPKLVRSYQDALQAGLDAEIVGNKVIVRKECESCGCTFSVPNARRETCYCSISCANKARDTRRVRKSLAETNRRKKEVLRRAQVEVYLELAASLGRDPQKGEWAAACKASGVSAECSRKSSPFRLWSDLVDSAKAANHRVVSVEDDGHADVYNGTVDDFHAFFAGGWDEGLTAKGRRKHVYINNLNCGETPNLNDEPCNLGSAALRRFVKFAGKTTTRVVDWDKLRHYARVMTRYLDDILDWNHFPHPEIDRAARLTRKLGLGVMGWADMLALLRIPYDTQDAVDLGGEVMRVIWTEARLESVELARRKGVYEAWKTLPDEYKTRALRDRGPAQLDEYEGYDPLHLYAPRRNSTGTSVAPTGTIALLIDNSSSIEPHFALEWERTTNEGITLKERIPVADEIGDFVPKTAREIDWRWHIKHQAAFQKFTDLGVSKTVNLPNSAAVEDVMGAYRMLWETGCKGGTVYRDGCRDEQVLVDAATKKTKSVYLVGGQEKTVEQIKEEAVQEYIARTATAFEKVVEPNPHGSPRGSRVGPPKRLELKEPLSVAYDPAASEAKIKKILADPAQLYEIPIVNDTGEQVGAAYGYPVGFKASGMNGGTPEATITVKVTEVEGGPAAGRSGAGGPDAPPAADRPAEASPGAENGAVPGQTPDNAPPGARDGIPLKPRKLPRERVGVTKKFKVGGTKGYVTANVDGAGRLMEIFVRVARNGSSVNGMLDAWAMSVSNLLQHGQSIRAIRKLHQDSRFEPAGLTGDPEFPTCTSVVDYIVRWLDARFGDGPTPPPNWKGLWPVGSTGAVPAAPAVQEFKAWLPYQEANGPAAEQPPAYSGQLCPDCGSQLVREGGCSVCKTPGCGFSRC